jgi:hypothetical protein
MHCKGVSGDTVVERPTCRVVDKLGPALHQTRKVRRKRANTLSLCDVERVAGLSARKSIDLPTLRVQLLAYGFDDFTYVVTT